MRARDANQIKQWRDQRLEGATGVFRAAARPDADPAIDVKTLHAKIGDLALAHDAPHGFRGPSGATVPAAISGALGKAGLVCRCAAAHASMRERGAQNDDRSHIEAQRQPPGRRAGDQRWRRHC